MMWRSIAMLVLAVVLVGCVQIELPNTTAPDYVVLLTTDTPSRGSPRCTGVLINERQVMTADHCTSSGKLRRALGYYGHQARIRAVTHMAAHDIAILFLDREMPAIYPDFASVDPALPAKLYGACGYWQPHQGRTIQHMTTKDLTLAVGGEVEAVDWWFSREWVCRGDSGGPIVQDGRVVGILLAQTLANDWSDYSQNVHTVRIPEAWQ